VGGGVLAGLGTLESFGYSTGWDRTKDFGGTRFKGYTIAVSDVNHGRLPTLNRKIWVGKNGGTSSNVVISRFEVSSPT
jgi:hypothetical protein